MSKELPENVSQAIRDYLNSTSLKADALKQMSVLADKVEEQEKQLEETNNRLALVKRERDNFHREIDRIAVREERCGAREVAVAEREAKMHDLEVQTAVANGKASVYHTCFELTMRNSVIKKNRFGSVPVADGSGYPTIQSTSEDTTETVE